MLQRAWGCMYLFEFMCSLSLDKYSEVELLGHMAYLFFVAFLRTLHVVFIGAAPVCSSTNSAEGPLSSILFVDFSIKAIVTGVRWYVTMVLICISLMTKHLFVCLLAICTFSMEKRRFMFSARVWLNCLLFCPLRSLRDTSRRGQLPSLCPQHCTFLSARALVTSL